MSAFVNRDAGNATKSQVTATSSFVAPGNESEGVGVMLRVATDRPPAERRT